MIASVFGLFLRIGAIASAFAAAYGAFTGDHHLDQVASYFVLAFLAVELILGNTADYVHPLRKSEGYERLAASAGAIVAGEPGVTLDHVRAKEAELGSPGVGVLTKFLGGLIVTWKWRKIGES